MNIVFVVQGEGRGHMTQALAMKDIMEAAGHTLRGVLVGTSGQRQVPKFFEDRMAVPIRRFASPNFITDAKGKGIRIGKSVTVNVAKVGQFSRSLKLIGMCLRGWEADLVVNFYEPLMGLYGLFHPKGVPVVAVAHQYVYLHPKFKFASGGWMQQQSLINFTRITCVGAKKLLGISLYDIPDGPKNLVVVPPLLRREVHGLTVRQGDYYLVYLLNSGYIDEIMEFHRLNPEVKLHCFTDRKEVKDELAIDNTLTFHQLSDAKFLNLMAGCRGFVSTAGFESIAEAMYLQKPVLMVPVAGHWEQQCNALDATAAGAGIHDTTFNIGRLLDYVAKHNTDNNAYKMWVDGAHGQISRILADVLKQTPKTSVPVAPAPSGASPHGTTTFTHPNTKA